MKLLFLIPLSWLLTAKADQQCTSTTGDCIHRKGVGAALLQKGLHSSIQVVADEVDNKQKESSLEHALDLVTKLAAKSGGHEWSLTLEERMALETIKELVENLFNTSLIQHGEDQFEVDSAKERISDCTRDSRQRRTNDIEPKKADANISRGEHAQCRVRENKIIANTSQECTTYHNYRKDESNFDPFPDCMSTALTQETIPTDEPSLKHSMESCLVHTVETMEPLYEEYLGCKEANERRKTASQDCAREQEEFELDYCEYTFAFASSCSTYSQCRSVAIGERNRVHAAVEQSEDARKADWVTATHLVCLLGVFTTDNDNKAPELEACMSNTVDTSNITVEYHQVPVADDCTPEQHEPCDDFWLNSEYKSQPWYNSSTINTCAPCLDPTPAPTPVPTPVPTPAPTELNPAESTRTYSSVWANDAGHRKSMLGSDLGWAAQDNQAGEWMQIDLQEAFKVSGVVTQGRANTGHTQWVTEYTVATSLDGSTFSNVASEPFAGNTGVGDAKVQNRFPQPVMARYVRIIAQAWEGHVTMRAGVLVV